MANTTLTDLLSLDMLESICANFYLYSGLSNYVVDAEGSPVTDSTYFYTFPLHQTEVLMKMRSGNMFQLSVTMR